MWSREDDKVNGEGTRGGREVEVKEKSNRDRESRKRGK